MRSFSETGCKLILGGTLKFLLANFSLLLKPLESGTLLSPEAALLLLLWPWSCETEEPIGVLAESPFARFEILSAGAIPDNCCNACLALFIALKASRGARLRY